MNTHRLLTACVLALSLLSCGHRAPAMADRAQRDAIAHNLAFLEQLRPDFREQIATGKYVVITRQAEDWLYSYRHQVCHEPKPLGIPARIEFILFTDLTLSTRVQQTIEELQAANIRARYIITQHSGSGLVIERAKNLCD